MPYFIQFICCLSFVLFFRECVHIAEGKALKTYQSFLGSYFSFGQLIKLSLECRFKQEEDSKYCIWSRLSFSEKVIQILTMRMLYKNFRGCWKLFQCNFLRCRGEMLIDEPGYLFTTVTTGKRVIVGTN